MFRLSTDKIIAKIEKGQTFEALSKDKSFRLKIEEYNPYLGAAVHNGHQLRKSLQKKCLLSDYERWFEEDPETASFISALPMVIEAKDSRYEYDLNRTPEDAVYLDEAWGKKLWKSPLSEKEIALSRSKHNDFYRIIHALVKKTEELFGACLVFDIHSYNYKRRTDSSPVFNIGTERIDQKKFGKYALYWQKELKKISLPNIETGCEINGPFKGRGYLLEYVHSKFSKSLVLATEIKKVYCDEATGEYFPLVSNALKEGMKEAVLNTANFFVKYFTDYKLDSRSDLLANTMEDEILKTDSRLYELTKDFSLLRFVNPVNYAEEKKAFFDSAYTQNPNFIYPQLNIDPFELKRELYNLPVERIRDINIQIMYRDTINAFADKIDMLASLGSEKFMFNSFRYFGVPDERVLKNADFLIRCPDYETNEKNLSSEDALVILKKTVDHYGFNCKLERSKNLASRAMVDNVNKIVKISRGEKFTQKEIEALAQHEIGVHMLTTYNSENQTLKIFNIGLPLNTKTQEGLALLSEFQSGTMNIARLRQLGARVLGIDLMINGYNFRNIFDYMMTHYTTDENAAFSLVTRIFRGGGFTKDYLYLDGFREMLDFVQEGKDPSVLLTGKTNIKYLDTLTEMADRELIQKPKYLTDVFSQPVKENNSILKYILNGIKTN